jgi:hypothetical protein
MFFSLAAMLGPPTGEIEYHAPRADLYQLLSIHPRPTQRASKPEPRTPAVVIYEGDYSMLAAVA